LNSAVVLVEHGLACPARRARDAAASAEAADRLSARRVLEADGELVRIVGIRNHLILHIPTAAFELRLLRRSGGLKQHAAHGFFEGVVRRTES
jgi:hypothetical protein